MKAKRRLSKPPGVRALFWSLFSNSKFNTYDENKMTKSRVGGILFERGKLSAMALFLLQDEMK